MHIRGAEVGGDAGGAPRGIQLPVESEWPALEKLKHEFDAIGFYLSAHPLDAYDRPLKALKVVRAAELPARLLRGGSTRYPMAGIVVGKQERTAKSGNRFALAITSAKRSAMNPEIPTFAEAGLDGLVANNWWGVFLPAGTPKAVVEQLNAAISKIVGQPEVKQQWGKQGATPMVMSVSAFDKYLQDDVQKWATVIRAANIKLD